jgi:microcystin-dependent protein
MPFSVPKSFVPDTTAKSNDVNENFDAVEVAINELMEAVVPAGTLIATARPTAPTGYLLCEGQAVSRTKYASLFGAIGTTYGGGDGSTTFNVPDMRGRVPVGVDSGAGRVTANNARGNSGGEEKHQLSSGEVASHNHGVSGLTIGGHHHTITMFQTVRHEGSGFGYEVWTPGGGAAQTVGTSWDDGEHPLHGSTDSAGDNSPHNNMQPYQAVNYAIKV